MKSLFSLLFITIFTVGTNASPTFLGSRSIVFAESSGQLMCRQLRREVPLFFDCSRFDKSNAVNSVPTDTPFLGMPVILDSETTGKFTSLYFPQNDCSVFLTLKSLCDLYFPLFERKLNQHKLPEEYKFLPLILSGLNPHYADNNGRAGLWASDYWVARREGLRVDSIVDERRGADFTTDKVLDYIGQLYRQYKGDHARTLVAYFRSNTYVSQIIQSSGTDNFMEAIDDESRDFLQLLIYTSRLFSSTKVENQLPNYFDILGSYESVFFTSEVQFEALNKLLGADPVTLRQMNPVYTGSRIEAAYRKVPFMLKKESAELFHQNESNLYNWIPPAPAVTEEKIIHIVKRGESLGTIAGKYRVSVNQLKSWNGLKKNSIRAGQKLTIIRILRMETPQVETPLSLPPTPPPASPDTLTKEERIPAKVPVPSLKKEIIHKVRSGESLWTISKKYKGVTPEKIMKWNNCGEKIQPGQRLKIHTGE